MVALDFWIRRNGCRNSFNLYLRWVDKSRNWKFIMVLMVLVNELGSRRENGNNADVFPWSRLMINAALLGEAGTPAGNAEIVRCRAVSSRAARLGVRLRPAIVNLPYLPRGLFDAGAVLRRPGPGRPRQQLRLRPATRNQTDSSSFFFPTLPPRTPGRRNKVDYKRQLSDALTLSPSATADGSFTHLFSFPGKGTGGFFFDFFRSRIRPRWKPFREIYTKIFLLYLLDLQLPSALLRRVLPSIPRPIHKIRTCATPEIPQRISPVIDRPGERKITHT